MSNAFIRNRNKVLFETLMNPKFHKEKKNFVLNESEPGERAFRAGAEMAGIPKSAYQYDNFPITDTEKLLDIVNTALDVLGVLDPTGIADLSNMMIYITRGKYTDAFFSLLGAALPYIGDVFKAGKVVSSALLKDVLKKLVQSPAGFAALKKILAWATSKGGKTEKFADWVASFIFKNDLDLITHSVLGKESKEVAQDIVNKKMVEATSVWSLRGQAAALKANPLWKSLEYALAGYMIPIHTQQKFQEQVEEMRTHMLYLAEQTRQEWNTQTGNEKFKDILLFQDEEGKSNRVGIDDFIKALQIYYIVQSTKNHELVAAVIASIGFSEEEAKSYLFQAMNMDFISQNDYDKISLAYFALEGQKSSMMNKIASVVAYLIPEFTERFDRENKQAKAYTSYIKDQTFKKSQQLYSNAAKISGKQTQATDPFAKKPLGPPALDMPDLF